MFLLWHVGPLVFIVACGTSTCSMWDLVPWSGINSSPVHWERAALDTRAPGKFLFFSFFLFLERRLTFPLIKKMLSLYLVYAELTPVYLMLTFVYEFHLSYPRRTCSLNNLNGRDDIWSFHITPICWKMTWR